MHHARDWFFKNYFAENLEDARRIASPGTEGGQFAMMVLSYWDQACAMLNYGLLHKNLFFETTGEFFGVWEIAKAVVPQTRELSRTNTIWDILKKPRSATKRGARNARPAVWRRCGR